MRITNLLNEYLGVLSPKNKYPPNDSAPNGEVPEADKEECGSQIY